MKLLKLSKINGALKKYSSLLLSSLLLLSKKDRMSNIMLYSLLAVLGVMFLDNKKGDKNIISKDWKEFINKQLKKATSSNNLSNEINQNIDNDDDEYEDDETDEEEEDQDNKNDNVKLFNEKNTVNIVKEIISKKKKEKMVNKIVDKNENTKAYPDKISKLNIEYNSKAESIFKLKVNENNKNTPIFNLRSSDKIDFYWNFHLHNADNSKINNLILCRDIHQWMNNSSLSNEDLADQCYPLYLIMKDHKTNNEIMIFEAYKIFVYPNENGNKHAFITKGDNYKTVEEIISILVNNNYVKDLLNEKEYESYNLTTHDSVCLFLNNLLSHFLPYEVQDNELISIDLEQYNENKNTFDYFYHTNNMDNEMFNTNI